MNPTDALFWLGALCLALAFADTWRDPPSAPGVPA